MRNSQFGIMAGAVLAGLASATADVATEIRAVLPPPEPGQRPKLRMRRSKYRPHQGGQEIDRRARQIAAGKLTTAIGLAAHSNGYQL